MINTSGIGLNNFRYLLYIMVCATLFFISSPPLFAESGTDQLRVRIEKMEKELAELKLLLQEQKDIEAKEAQSSSPVGGFTFKPYGYVKLDLSYDDSRTNYGNFILYVPSESANKKDDNEFNMTARQTRLGMEIIAPSSHNWSARGKIEIDFYGDGSTQHENKAEIVLRHAFIELERENYSLLGGQTSDLISPLNPSTLNYIVGWSAGNIAYRRPQLRITYNNSLNDKNRIITALSLSRTSGLVNEDLDLGGQNDGEDAGFPTIQARIALATKSFTEKESVFGISGHYGNEEIDWGRRAQRLKSYSINYDFDIPLSNQFSIKGEAFTGINLDDYFGGILQGVNRVTRDVIRTSGGWAQINYKPDDKWQYNAGIGFDNPSDVDLETGMRSRNGFIYLNTLYRIIPPMTMGIEYSHWETEYIDMNEGTDNRLQASWIYSW
ncbi:hypothetical protein OAC89_04655 [Deltaproteobacteria bacterium]|nr:hypothetical protein [Deltaproteobacteria bacterium]